MPCKISASVLAVPFRGLKERYTRTTSYFAMRHLRHAQVVSEMLKPLVCCEAGISSEGDDSIVERFREIVSRQGSFESMQRYTALEQFSVE
uniref:BACK domain-containing protein n=1 Tax=Parascaris univalens TaxID=6257 RepID=A0A914ZEE9_PARUN